VTESPVPNPGMMKLGGVALAAYLLGRMKKGKAAVGLAMWAAGVKMDPKQLLREGLLSIANSAEGKQLLTQLRGPVLQAGRQAAGATIEGQVAALTAALEKRTAALTAGVGQATEAAQKAADKAQEAADSAQESVGKAEKAVDGAVGEAGEKAAGRSGGGKVTGLFGRRKKDKAQPEQESAAEDS
jgi:hypothetical protein